MCPFSSAPGHRRMTDPAISAFYLDVPLRGRSSVSFKLVPWRACEHAISQFLILSHKIIAAACPAPKASRSDPRPASSHSVARSNTSIPHLQVRLHLGKCWCGWTTPLRIYSRFSLQFQASILKADAGIIRTFDASLRLSYGYLSIRNMVVNDFAKLMSSFSGLQLIC